MTSWRHLFEGYERAEVGPTQGEVAAPLAGAHGWRLTVPAETAGVRISVCGRCGVIHAETKGDSGWQSAWRRWNAKRGEWEAFAVAPPLCLPASS